VTLHQGQQDDDPGDRYCEAGQDQRPLPEPPGQAPGGQRGQQDATVAAVKITPLWMAS